VPALEPQDLAVPAAVLEGEALVVAVAAAAAVVVVVVVVVAAAAADIAETTKPFALAN
jgi:hypothetical protein